MEGLRGGGVEGGAERGWGSGGEGRSFPVRDEFTPLTGFSKNKIILSEINKNILN